MSTYQNYVKQKGCDVDKPRNLAKSVTVEQEREKFDLLNAIPCYAIIGMIGDFCKLGGLKDWHQRLHFMRGDKNETIYIIDSLHDTHYT